MKKHAALTKRRRAAWCLVGCLGMLCFHALSNDYDYQYHQQQYYPSEWASRQTSNTVTSSSIRASATDKTDDTSTPDKKDDDEWDVAIPVPLRQPDPSTYNPVNHNLAFQVQHILHYPRQHKIVVHLHPNRTECQSPVLMGRLSGVYLGMIHWQDDSDDDSLSSTTTHNSHNNNPVVGFYSVRQPGRYNIEILGLACERVTPQTKLQTRCVQDPHHHRLTQDHAHIFIPRLKDPPSDSSTTTARQHHHHHHRQRLLQKVPTLGFWKNQRGNPLEPLHTRFQPTQCRQRTELETARCRRRMSEDRFRPYEFEFRTAPSTSGSSSPIGHLQRLALSLPSKKTGSHQHHTICALGWSHSRVLVEHAMPWLVQAGLNQTIQLVHIGARFPQDVTPDFVQEQNMKQECDMVIVGLFQWPLAGRNTPPTGNSYRNHMQNVLQILQRHLSEDAHVFVRSGHYNPLGDWISSCPAKDLRSPVNVQLFNKMLQQAVDENGQAHYLDTNSIVQPLWDSAHDWNHYSGKVSDTEAWYILQQVLQVAGRR